MAAEMFEDDLLGPVEEAPGLGDDLFGDDPGPAFEEDAGFQPDGDGQAEQRAEAELEDDVELPGPSPAEQPEASPPPPALSDAQARKAAMATLAAKRRAVESGEAPKKKKQKKDRSEKGERGGGGSSGRPARSRRQKPGEGGRDKEQPQEWGPELPEDEYQETAADKDFIDDEGVPEDERYEGDDLEVLANAEEAEEAVPGEEELPDSSNPIDEVMARRKRSRKRGGEDADVDSEVMMLVTQMMACAEKDASAMEARPPQPAIEKLKALPEVGKLLRQRKYHDSFLASKGLTALSAWLRPYANGTLPNAKVRRELVELLGLLGLDTTSDYVRERLEESELGKIIMFYFKNPNESMTLRAQCRDLIQAWSAPIFADNDEEQRKRRQRERQHRQRQAAEKAERERREQLETAEADRRRRLNVGEEGFRARAAVPMPSRMDFVINPGSRLDPLEALQQGGGAAAAGSGGPKGKQQSPIGGRLGKVLQQRKRGARNRIGGMSVEGRGIQL